MYDEYDSRSNIYEVNINITPSNGGKGLGKKLLTRSIKKLFDEVKDCKLIRAKVENVNESSKKIFTLWFCFLRE